MDIFYFFNIAEEKGQCKIGRFAFDKVEYANCIQLKMLIAVDILRAKIIQNIRIHCMLLFRVSALLEHVFLVFYLMLY